MKNALKELLTLILSNNVKDLNKVAAIVTTIIAIAITLVIMWGCSAQYAHCMRYTDGEKTVQIECETRATAEK